LGIKSISGPLGVLVKVIWTSLGLGELGIIVMYSCVSELWVLKIIQLGLTNYGLVNFSVHIFLVRICVNNLPPSTNSLLGLYHPFRGIKSNLACVKTEPSFTMQVKDPSAGQ
jgi:hypothetical protein